MLRLLVALLLLANAAYFAWVQGWLEPMLPPPQQGQREPARVAAQVQPELIAVMTPKAASAALAAAAQAAPPDAPAGPPLCLEAGPLTENQLAAAESALRQAAVADGTWTREQVARSPTWAVYMGRFGDAEVMRIKAAELRRLNVAFEEMRAPSNLVPGIKITSHDERAAADASLAQLTQRGVRSARVVEVPSSSPTQHWLRVARADADLQARLRALPAAPLAGGFSGCKHTAN